MKYFFKKTFPFLYLLERWWEIKKAKTRNYHNYFLNLNQTFLQFENLIATRFYQYLRVALVLDTELTNWLLSILRKTKKPFHSLVSNPISTTYKAEETSIVEQKNSIEYYNFYLLAGVFLIMKKFFRARLSNLSHFL